MCFGCSRENPVGLHLRFFRDGDGVRAEATLAEPYQGAPGVVHGGIQAALLDESCCAAAFFTRDTSVVTGELVLRYRRPCSLGRPLYARARVAADEGRYLVVHAALYDGDDGSPLTVAEGKFYRDREARE